MFSTSTFMSAMISWPSYHSIYNEIIVMSHDNDEAQ